MAPKVGPTNVCCLCKIEDLTILPDGSDKGIAAVMTDSLPALTIRDFTDADAAAFHDINAAWIRAMFELEAHDIHVLTHPRETILDPGGAILLAEVAGQGVIGTCALMKIAPGVFELTKMGVLESTRGLKAGEKLLAATLERARSMEMSTLFLLTNAKCEAAIHLYEKLGFVHDAGIMRDHGSMYGRCDVAMSYPIAA